MGRKTASKKYQRQDQLRLLRRQFLSYSEDYAHICYGVDKPQLPAPAELPEQQGPAAAFPTPPVATESPKPEASGTPSPVVVPLEDNPLSALDVVVALAAQKLKQPFDHVPAEKSIRDLSGGNIENELSKACWMHANLRQQASPHCKMNSSGTWWPSLAVFLMDVRIFPWMPSGLPCNPASLGVQGKSCLP